MPVAGMKLWMTREEDDQQLGLVVQQLELWLQTCSGWGGTCSGVKSEGEEESRCRMRSADMPSNVSRSCRSKDTAKMRGSSAWPASTSDSISRVRV